MEMKGCDFMSLVKGTRERLDIAQVIGECIDLDCHHKAFLTNALTYAARGWSVLPLNGKIPAIPKAQGGHGYLDATTDPAQIREWWDKRPHANIGIATRASGLLVVDVDDRKGGPDTLAALERRHGPLPETPEVITGTLGRHMYSLAPVPDTVLRKSDALGPGLDLPNYVVAPPSIHPDTGRTYQWDMDRHPDWISIAEAPQWLLALLRDGFNSQRILRYTSPPGWLGLVYEAIVSYIEEQGERLRTDGNGGMTGRCPLHADRNPSFSIHPERGWICFSGCGHGRLTLLAHRLGISLLEHRS